MIDIKGSPFNLSDEQKTWVDNKYASLSDDEKIEQLFCPLISKIDEDHLLKILSKYNFGAFMFRRGTACEIQSAVYTAQKAAKIPLLIAANLEDGANGLAAEGTYMGKQMLIAATGDAGYAYKLGKLCGREGSALGVNWSFAPVADIDLNCQNPITNVRTFGDNADTVLEMSRAYIKGLLEEGVIPAVKHFPGDGVDNRDQHLLTSVNTMLMDEWENSFGKIYRSLINDGAMTVMAGHIAMPAMEEYFDKRECRQVIPSSCSHNVLKYLRQNLGFNGLIITDASPMAGFTASGERKITVPLSIENGCDMFLFTKDMEEDISYMKKGYESGRLSEKRLRGAVTRILAVKAALKLHEHIPQKKINDKSVLSCEEHKNWACSCADKAVTLVKDTQNLLPLNPKKMKKILLQILGDSESNERVISHFEKQLCAEGFEVTRYVRETLDTIFADSSAEKFKAKYDLVFYIGNIETESNKTVNRINWHTLFGAGNNIPWFVNEIPALFVSVGNPYHLMDVPMIKTYINGYCNSSFVIDAVMNKLMGKSKFTGISPVDPFCGKWDTKF